MTTDEDFECALRESQVQFEEMERIRQAKQIVRDRAILKALAEGWTHQQISDATGLSRGRISQIKEKS